MPSKQPSRKTPEMWLNALYRNHVLANLSYFMVLMLGMLAYTQLPKEKAPDSVVSIATVSLTLPGASADDVEHERDLAAHHVHHCRRIAFVRNVQHFRPG